MEINFNDADFKKSTMCTSCSHCVEVANKNDMIAVRDTKDPSQMPLQFNKEEWQAFVAGVKRGEFDF
ncbi:MAG: DUF397 domain-containing protein [Gammaproteobacteria bacterium]|nr:DUF397 domain-containing protein [Gammaproteobacteria bacterium]